MTLSDRLYRLIAQLETGGGLLGIAVATTFMIIVTLVAPFVTVGLLLLIFVGVALHLSPGDPVTVLSVGVAALFGISVRWVVGPYGGGGSPAILVGLLCLGWWLVSRFGRTESSTSPWARTAQPVRAAVGAMMLMMIVSYMAGAFRIRSEIEASNADLTLVVWLGLAGVALLTADGVGDRNRLDVLLRRMVLGAAYMSFVALVQFVGKIDLSEILVPPGLQFNAPVLVGSSLERADFTRVAGTADHPIEFGVVAATMLPLALHYGFNDHHRSLLARWAPVGVIGLAVPMAISRSAILGFAIVALMLFPTLTPQNRLTMLVGGFAGMLALMVIAPGLLGTIRSFFTNAGSDPSVTGRTEDYEIVTETFLKFPIAGRGFGTFTPSAGFDFLDNQYLMTLVESGLLGLVGLLFFLAAGLSAATSVRRRTTDRRTADLAHAMAAGIMVNIVAFATYDSLVFRTSAMTLFLLIGAAGALWRLTVKPGQARRWLPFVRTTTSVATPSGSATPARIAVAGAR